MTSPPRNISDLSVELEHRLREAGQDHVVDALAALDGDGRRRLLDELESIEWSIVGKLRNRILAEDPPHPDHDFAPPEVFPLDRTPAQEARAESAEAEGARLLSEGRVGCVVVAGGQASRLGIDAPKGTVPAGPVSGRSLFELFARKLRAAAMRYGHPVPFYVMTSPTNDAATRAFFADHGFFGLDPDDVFFFIQGVLPGLDDAGRALFARRDGLALAPTGHGGIFSALRNSGAYDDLSERGVRYLSYFQVDNPLVLPTDPLFIGLHAGAQAGMSSKVVERSGPDEKVGVIGLIDGRHGCIEYSNLPDELRSARNPDGSLRFGAGNIAMHMITVDFARDTVGGSEGLPWTLAYKKMNVIDADGRPIEQMAYKAEMFVFDALAFSDQTITLEIDRSVEFSPIKNASGEDSPATARADMCALHAGWAARGGRALPAPDDDGVIPVEVDPPFALTEPQFLERMPAEPEVLEGGHLYTLEI